MNTKRKAITSWVQLGIYCALILTQSFFSMPVKVFHHADKVAHFLIYGVLGVLVFRAFRFVQFGDRIVFRAFTAFVISSFVGLFDEILQIFTPTRTLDLEDLYCDMAGCFAGIVLYIIYKSRKNISAQNREVK